MWSLALGTPALHGDKTRAVDTFFCFKGFKTRNQEQTLAEMFNIGNSFSRVTAAHHLPLEYNDVFVLKRSLTVCFFFCAGIIQRWYNDSVLRQKKRLTRFEKWLTLSQG